MRSVSFLQAQSVDQLPSAAKRVLALPAGEELGDRPGSRAAAGEAASSGGTWPDVLRELIELAGGWLVGLGWLTGGAWVLTLGCLGCAILDSYTSLCVVGGTLGHIGSAAACPDFGGWDTRVFPLAVDMGWGGALCAVLRLAKAIGMKNPRWWFVLAFEVVTAAFTIVGNSFHGAVADGAAAHLPWSALVLITCLASAVPGVVAVGSGFTLSVLISSAGPVHPDDQRATGPEISGMARRDPDAGRADGRGPGRSPVMSMDTERAWTRPTEDRSDDRPQAAEMTATQARQAVNRLVRRAQRAGRQVTIAEVERVTGRQYKQASRLLKDALAAAGDTGQSTVVTDRSPVPPPSKAGAGTNAAGPGSPADPSPPVPGGSPRPPDVPTAALPGEEV